MVKDAEKIFYNLDSIKLSTEVVVVEGEIDALSFIEAGYMNVVSVPNGSTLGTSNLDYLDNCIEYFENKEKIYLALDNDEAGKNTTKEFIRRLGFERCKIANLKQYKDLNEVLVSEGRESVQNVLKSAKILKADDVYELQDFYNDIDAYFESGLPQGKKLGISELDEKIRWMTSHLAVVTGSPTSGKSEFVDFVISKLNVSRSKPCICPVTRGNSGTRGLKNIFQFL